ncbi:HEAT repeat domain-containing protein [Alkalihalobacillus sp. AL-G]|uniref:HEAT repeat domain-containing protein n=1 Tax=Alkalihalobacillus sp. AL-G TaxID=2926399 RepID=UPI00272CD741|nr:hypothetical protein [Alkalihalobacillus sp. AL-G]WLD94832.1 hypothetical protein MOJ78_08115 [Alkalihalobacillus sp. AL-G]
MNEWGETMKSLLQKQQWKAAIACIERDKTTHAGTAPAHIKRKAVKLILSTYKNNPEKVLEAAEYFSGHNSPTAKEISAHLLPEVYSVNPDSVAHLLHEIADDDNWEVREWAAGGCGELLTEQFDEFYPVLYGWKDDQSENVRRAVALAVMYASKRLGTEYASKLLQVFEHLMADSSTYVKRNLGPFAIGDALLKRYPEQVIPWLKKIAETDDENVRWNVAMVFTSAASRTYFNDGDAVLSLLENDERASIQRAIKKARRNLEKARVQI